MAESAWAVETLDVSDRSIAVRVAEIQRAAYAVEAELIGFGGIPGRLQSPDDLIATVATLDWSGIRDSGKIVAAMAVQRGDSRCDVDRLIVDPRWFRRGLGRALVASLPKNVTVTVSTGTKNLPAVSLYESTGFRVESTEEVAPDVTITRFRRPPEADTPAS